ncbi:hypothetical protein ACFL2Q_17355, partial [Thermodesulfobacteriota bacterium]
MGTTVKVKRNDPIPGKHLKMAEHLFANKGFDYYPMAKGYEIDGHGECKTALGEKTNENETEEELNGWPIRYDVECEAGLVRTPLAVLQAKLCDPYYVQDVNHKHPPDLKELVEVGDIIAVVVYAGPAKAEDIEWPEGSELEDLFFFRDDLRTLPYTHSMYVKSVPEPVEGKESTWEFEVFHSQRASIGPEYSTVTVQWGKFGGPAFSVSISSCGNPFLARSSVTRIGITEISWSLYNLEYLHVAVMGRAYEFKCFELEDPEEYIVRDPVVFDLDGYGIHTIGLDADLHFDHDGDGFAELTGWVDGGDGVLVRDKNGNNKLDDGSELFSDYTFLSNGKRATSGFGALAYYDANEDGRIDANDSIWSELKIWQGYAYNGRYTFDPHEHGMLSTLDELGITAIDLDYTDTNITDEAGNTEVRSGQFLWADGSAGTFAEYTFQTDGGDT